jgi:UDP-N-acetyl-D-glucosamine dehydrogenase
VSRDKTYMNIAVIGLGKIGLPLAVQYAKKGKRVFGVDTNEETVKSVNQGLEPFPGEENLSIFLKEVVEECHLSATSNYEEALGQAEVIVIATPLLIDDLNQPDFTILDSVSESIGLYIRKGSLVILETTVPIGTTRNRLSKIIEKNSSLQAGKDFLVAFSPERVFTGRIFEDLKRYPKLVGGINQESGLRAKEFYDEVLDFDLRPDLKRKNGVWLMQNAEAAEFAKLAETTYRDVNIALANQYAKHASQLNLDVLEIIEASNSQPFSHIHNPGIWVGGHCIPVYPHLYMHTDHDARIVEISREVNLSMCENAIQRVVENLGDIYGLHALILGVSYRSGVKEVAHSGVFELKRILSEIGVQVTVFDPMFSSEEISLLGLTEYNDSMRIDLIFVQTYDHKFLELNLELFANARLVVDGRNLFGKEFDSKFNILRI